MPKADAATPGQLAMRSAMSFLTRLRTAVRTIHSRRLTDDRVQRMRNAQLGVQAPGRYDAPSCAHRANQTTREPGPMNCSLLP